MGDSEDRIVGRCKLGRQKTETGDALLAFQSDEPLLKQPVLAHTHLAASFWFCERCLRAGT